MPFPPKRDHKITRAEAEEMTKKHRQGSPGGGSEKAHMFPRDVFEALLKDPKVRGIRLYHGRNNNNETSMIAVGVDENGDDLLDGDIFDRGFPCPPVCGGGNSLNS
jgi:hypothetical protein